MTSQVASPQQTTAIPVATSKTQTAGAMLFGLLVLFAVGFSPMEVAHNAAHDTRHALAFPCH